MLPPLLLVTGPRGLRGTLPCQQTFPEGTDGEDVTPAKERDWGLSHLLPSVLTLIVSALLGYG